MNVKDKKIINSFLKNKVINKIEYLENIPLEDNCIEIIFSDNSYLLIYAIMRVVYQKEIILCSVDYYFDKNFIENSKAKCHIENTLIFDALKKTNKIIEGKTIRKIDLNSYGDLLLEIDKNVTIEVFIDTMENDKDYYAYYGTDEKYFHFYKSNKKLVVAKHL